MCRLMAYYGDPILLAQAVLHPSRSIIRQSYDARERLQDHTLPAHLGHGNLNADGFGIGWFNERPRCKTAGGPDDQTPCTFKAITPAWNNDNLARLASKIYSPLMFAHVRAAYPGMPVSEQNCHPFAFKRYMFMHNGVIAGFNQIRRHLVAGLSDSAYDAVQSFHSDSAVSFALFLNFLPDTDRELPADALLRAMQLAIDFIAKTQEAHQIMATSLLNFVVTDGSTLIATRFVSPATDKPASLYYAEGSTFRPVDGVHVPREGEYEYELEFSERGSRVVIVASEPITGSKSDWVAVPKNHALVVTRDRNSGYIDVIHTPICSGPPSQRQKEVLACLAAANQVGTTPQSRLNGAMYGSAAQKLARVNGAANGCGFNACGHLHGTPGTVQQQLLDALWRHNYQKQYEGAGHRRCTSDGVAAIQPTIAAPPLLGARLSAAAGRPRVRPVSPLHDAFTPPFPSPIADLAAQTASSASAASRLGAPPPPSASIPFKASSRRGSAPNIAPPYATPPHFGPVVGSKASSVSSTAAATPEDSDSLSASMRRALSSQALNQMTQERASVRWAPESSELTIEEHILTGHSAAVMCMAQDADGMLYTSSADKTIKVWDLATLQLAATLDEHSKPVLKLQCNGKRLYSVGGATMRAWDTSSHACIVSILTASSHSAGAIRAICVHEDQSVYVGSQDTTLKEYQLNVDAPTHDGKTLAEVIALLPSEGCSDKLQDGSSAQPSLAPSSPPAYASPAATPRQPPSALGLPSPRPPAPSAAGLTPSAAAAPSHSGATYTTSLHVRACSVEESHCSAINSLVCCQQYVCSASGDGTIRVWRRETLKLAGILRGHRGAVLTLLALGGLLLSGGRDNLIRVWDIDAMVCRRTLPGHTDDVLFLTGSPPSLAWNGNSFGEHHFLDALADESAIDGQSDGGGGEAWAPSEAELAVIASCSSDGTCRLWSGCTWCCIHVFRPQPAADVLPVLCGALVRDVLALGLSDGTIWIYSISNLLQAIFEKPEALVQASLSISGNDVCTGLGPDLAQATMAEHSEAADIFPMCDNLGQPERPSSATGFTPDQPPLLPWSARSHTDPGNRRTRAVTHGVTWRRPYQIKENAEMRMDVALLFCLKQLVRIKTVSGDPALAEECFRGAKFLAGLLESMGAEVKLAMSADSVHPVVLGRFVTCPTRPTVMFYGHYDVQPAHELDWKSNPFKLVARDGYLYGRGTSDNKGPILAMIFAVRELLDRNEGEECGGLPVNVGFVFEGEEEIGSMGLSDVVKEHLDWFNKPDLIIISNSNWIGDVVPCITYGMRGMICLSVEVSGGAHDLHSGNEGGVINEPMSDLCRLLATLVDSRSNILIPGFYDDVDPDLLDPTLRGMQESADVEDFNVKAYAERLGVQHLSCSNTVEDVLTKRWCLPSLSVADVRSSTTDASTAHFGPTRFSVAPKLAQGNISIRYVPSQTAEALVDNFQRHMKHEFRKLQSNNQMTIHVKNRGQYWQADPDSSIFKMATRAVEQEWERTALAVREGGTMPCASMLETLLEAPVIMLPMGQSSDNCHLSNERIRRINLIKGKNVVRRILESFAGKDASE